MSRENPHLMTVMTYAHGVYGERDLLPWKEIEGDEDADVTTLAMKAYGYHTFSEDQYGNPDGISLDVHSLYSGAEGVDGYRYWVNINNTCSWDVVLCRDLIDLLRFLAEMAPAILLERAQDREG